MADHGYTTRRYAPQENSYDAWNARKSGFETQSDGWGKTGYASNGEAYPRDHVCRPVIIDAQGRKRPLIAYTPENKMDNYVTTTETIIEQVRKPEGTRYGNISPRKVAPLKEYGVMNNGWSTPVSPDRPHRVEEFINQVQTDASQPSRSGLVSHTHWRQKFNPHGNGHGSIFGHGKNGDQLHHGGRTEMMVTSEYKEEPALITEGGWARPNRAAWSAPVPLTKPTNDIGTAVEFLKEAATTVPTQRRFTIPTPMVPRMEVIPPNRDNHRRYGGLGPQVGNTTDTYSSSAMDSREAARRYRGQTM